MSARLLYLICLLALLVLGVPDSPAARDLPTLGGTAFAQAGCDWRGHNGHDLLVCPWVERCRFFGVNLGCANVGRFRSYCATHPGIPPCAAFARDSAGGSGGGDQNGASTGSPTPGISINEDAKVVKNCAAVLTGSGPPNLFLEVAGMGPVTVTYGDATVYMHEDNVTLVVLALGKSEYDRGKVNITLDHERIAADAKRNGISYWREFARTLYHEYHHARDYFTCNCNNPHQRLEPERTLDDYEDDTEDKAINDADALTSCLPE